MELNLNNGFVSDYDDFYLWVEKFEEDADAYVITKDEDGEAESAAKAKVGKVITRSTFGSEDDYNDATDELLNEEYDTFAEFMTIDDVYYVGVEQLDEAQPVESFDMGPDVNYC